MVRKGKGKGKGDTTRRMYFNVYFRPGLPGIKDILQYMSLLYQTVTMKTVVPDYY